MAEQPAPASGFTNKEILLRLEAKVDAYMLSADTRLRSLEAFRSRLIGAVRALAIGLPIAITIVAAILTKGF